MENVKKHSILFKALPWRDGGVVAAAGVAAAAYPKEPSLIVFIFRLALLRTAKETW